MVEVCQCVADLGVLRLIFVFNLRLITVPEVLWRDHMLKISGQTASTFYLLMVPYLT